MGNTSRPVLPTANEAEIILHLWSTGRLDTADIARLMSLPEHVVSRTIHAARDVTRLLYAEGAAE